MYKDMLDANGLIVKYDDELAQSLNRELSRQRGNLELIASENIVSPAVLAALGTVLTNKYAEGYPGKRYYGGCMYADQVEELARTRAKKLFGAEHANVQPHSGAQANLSAYLAVLSPGDTVLGMSLSCGGHLTHGSKVNASGKLYNFIQYGVDEKGYIDYGALRALALKNKPKLIVAGASAYPRIIEFERISEIAKECGALLMVDMAHIAGLVAAGVHPSPVPYADIVTSTTHKTLRGPRGGLILCRQEYAAAIDKAVFPGHQGGPLMHTIAAKAVCFKEAMSDEFAAYSKQVVENAKTLADALMKKGVKIVSGGTDNHLLLVDLIGTPTNGRELEAQLDEVRITVNKNSIPNDPTPPSVTSGIRIGTPAVTTRGFKRAEMEQVADMLAMAINDFYNNRIEILSKVNELCARFPLYE